jgi:hypothetical protein
MIVSRAGRLTALIRFANQHPSADVKAKAEEPENQQGNKYVSAGLKGIHFRRFVLSHLSEGLPWGTLTR